MNRKLLLALGALIPAAIAAAPGEASAQDIIWHVDMARALGSGCSSTAGDTEFIAFGNDVAVLFSAFGLNLPAPNNGLKNCSVRIPVTIREGFYAADLIQTLTFGYNKSFGASGSITTLASFFNRPVASFNVPIPVGFPLMNPADVRTRSTPIVVFDTCAGSLSGLYRSDLAVAASTGGGNGFINLATQGLDIRYQITIPIFLCPLP